MCGDHGEVMDHAVNLVMVVFKNDSEAVINLHQLMVVADVLVAQRQSDHVTLINVQVNISFLNPCDGASQ